MGDRVCTVQCCTVPFLYGVLCCVVALWYKAHYPLQTHAISSAVQPEPPPTVLVLLIFTYNPLVCMYCCTATKHDTNETPKSCRNYTKNGISFQTAMNSQEIITFGHKSLGIGNFG